MDGEKTNRQLHAEWHESRTRYEACSSCRCFGAMLCGHDRLDAEAGCTLGEDGRCPCCREMGLGKVAE